MAIILTIILVPYHLFKPMQLIWRSGTHWFHLRVPNLQVNWELDHMIMCCTRIVAAILAAGRHAPLFFNTLRARQHGCHFADDIFKCIFLNENVWISIRSSLKFVPTGPIYNIPAMVQITAWRWPGNKPLSEPTRTPAFWDTPAALWLPIQVIHIRSQVKTRQSQSYKFWKIAKNSKFCTQLYTRHTFWSCLIRCINIKWIQPEL